MMISAMKKTLSLIAASSLLPLLVQAQFGGDLNDKPGTFEILSRTDYASTQCGFTKADMTANLQRITAIVNEMRKNPVLADIRGFSGRARIYNASCEESCKYGVPARISFEFSSFFRDRNGKVIFNVIEPPEWSLYTNKVYPIGGGFCANGFDSEKCYFTVPLNKRTIQPGIDIYADECVVIYDPRRPDYWIPVTVEEAFASAKAGIDKEKDPVAAAYLRQFFDQEYADIPAGDYDKPAFYGGGIARVTSSPDYQGQDSLFPRIMKVNPAYWNKNLPKSAIQFITLHSLQNHPYLKRELEDCQKHRDVGSGCDLARFEYSLSMDDIRRLAPLVGK